ncbi:hypothetical protein BAC2_02093 [uncultured bacterium]|nr:hypothetical protein BAC2_02093 [uncultured bacterium]
MSSSDDNEIRPDDMHHDEPSDNSTPKLTRRQALQKFGLAAGTWLFVSPLLNGLNRTLPPDSEESNSLDSASIAAACVHSWSYTNILEIKDTGSDSTHRIYGKQRCSKCGATRYATTYENHKYVWTWYAYYKYTAAQHEYKKEYVCSTCNHKKNVSTYQAHQWTSIYDTQCDLCGQTR